MTFLLLFLQFTSFELAQVDEFTILEDEVGVWRAAPGHAEIQTAHVGEGNQALHLFGGEKKMISLRFPKPLKVNTGISFLAERWTSRSPFELKVEGRVGAKWVELWNGAGVKVGGFHPYAFFVRRSKVKEIRFVCTSPAESGLLLDSVRVDSPAPMKLIRPVHVVKPSLPVLIGNKLNPVACLELETSGNLKPLHLRGITINLEGTTSLRDIESIEIFALGGESVFNWVKPNEVFSAERLFAKAQSPFSKTIVLKGNQELVAGKNQIWISVRLIKTASMDSRIGVNVDTFQLDSEEWEVILSEGQEGQTQRIGIALRNAGDSGSACYRIPGLTTTPKGTLIAVYDIRWRNTRDLPDDIDVGMSRSTDGGRTWEKMQIVLNMGDGPGWNFDGVGDPSVLVDEQTGESFIFALWSHGNRGWNGSGLGLSPEETGQLVMTQSSDDGKTWSKPINLTKQLKKSEWRLMLQGPGRGITMQNGTLVLPMQFRDSPENGSLPSSFIAWSKDHGKTWQSSNAPKKNTTEAQVAELSDGTLMLNMRDNRGGSRSVYITNDLGETWQEHSTTRRGLPEPVCMASLISIPNIPKGLLFSNPNVSRAPRRNMTIKGSLDDGMTWPEKHQLLLDEGSSAGYSCLTMIDEKTVGILFEGSRAHMTFMRIPLADLNLSARGK